MFLALEASPELGELLARARGGGAGALRLLQVRIRDERLVLGAHRGPEHTWDGDWDRLLLPLLDGREPCYVLYRLDTRNQQGYEWLFICWSPDQAPVKLKMLHAAARAGVKAEFGGGRVKDELFGTSEEDVCLHGYLRHVASCCGPAPLTAAEQELRRIKIGQTMTSSMMSQAPAERGGGGCGGGRGLAFPLRAAARGALQGLAGGRLDYVQLRLEVEDEAIELVHCEPTSVQQLPQRVPRDVPRYHFFLYRHRHQGAGLESLVFIYSLPGSGCSVRERVLYSSGKARLLEEARGEYGLEVSQKLEIEDGDDLTEDFLSERLHPPAPGGPAPSPAAPAFAFAKPRGPAGKRGGRRLIRGPRQEGEGLEGEG